MEKKLFTLISVLLIAAFALTACGTPTAAPITAPPATEIPVAVPATEVPVQPPLQKLLPLRHQVEKFTT